MIEDCALNSWFIKLSVYLYKTAFLRILAGADCESIQLNVDFISQTNSTLGKSRNNLRMKTDRMGIHDTSSRSCIWSLKMLTMFLNSYNIQWKIGT